MNSEEIIKNIMDNTGMSKKEVEDKINEKSKEMPNISEQGIALMVSKEMNVSVQNTQGKDVTVDKISPNMTNINFKAKILSKTPVRSFSTSRGEGRVQNVILSDETGKIRMSLWNDEIEKFGDIKEGDSVKLTNCRSKEDNLQNPEVRLGYNGNFEKLEEDVASVPPKTDLSDIQHNDEVEINGMLLEVFERPLVYYFCPQCNQKATNSVCPEHGTIEPEKRLIVSGVLDDGNRSINAVFFGNEAENLLQKTTDEIESETQEKSVSDLIDSLDVITKEFKINGQISTNKMNGELELRVKNVSPKG